MREPHVRDAALPLHYGKHIFSTAGINLHSRLMSLIRSPGLLMSKACRLLLQDNMHNYTVKYHYWCNYYLKSRPVYIVHACYPNIIVCAS